MCGIAGFCNLPGNWEEDIKNMNHRMYHRGPNASGIWSTEDKSVVLGHQRLSIVDLSENGSQPMVSHSGRFVMVYNGEIYNYKVLRDKLLAEHKVERFCSTSDTEVLLEAMEAYGVQSAINMCKGMFAIALYDTREQQLYLLRDRVGEKPLYYGFVGNGFVFASDLGSISVLRDFHNEINTDILDLYFVHGYIPAPYSIYRDIYKLEPGTILRTKAPFTSRTPEITTFWSMKDAAKKGQSHLFTGSRVEAADELERLLKQSIAGQMVADVPVGAFLSAGIDSSTIVALMQSLSSQKVRSFTIGMEDAAYNEAIIAKEIAKHLGTEHTEMYISEEDAKNVIPGLSHMFSEPFADSSQIPTYLVSKMTGEHVTVSLSGDGGDELFCGYNSYPSVMGLWNRLARIPYPIRKICSDLVLHTPLKRNKDICVRGRLLAAKGPEKLYEISNQEENIADRITRNHTHPAYKYSEYETGFLQEPHHNLMLMDLIMYHPDDILVKVDRCGMAVSLESRIPMLDKDVVEFAWTLPQDYLRQGDTGKLVLRDVLYRYVPRELMERPKTGFAIPIDKWLKQPKLRAWAETLLDPKLIAQQGILNPDTVNFIWKDYVENGVWRVQIWYLLMLQEWLTNENHRAV
ncbi:MAG: asparagine synthase (glutamine-hydrolyzing) [Lachnospiraceae bacterium]|nr:asparagine synthase (glutamine-hydrolyzing) [Lachnospiraceae bacterium]